MKIRITVVVCAALGIAFGVGLGASADPPGSESPTLISQKDKVFAPTELTVAVGESVVFRNDDPVTHNVFSRTKGAQFNLKMQKPGQEDVVKLETPGDVIVRCAIHPTMKLTIHVEEGNEDLGAAPTAHGETATDARAD